MNLTVEQIKELISFGHDIGLQQLSIGNREDGLSVVYGARAVMPASMGAPDVQATDAQSITAYYAALGKGQLKP